MCMYVIHIFTYSGINDPLWQCGEGNYNSFFFFTFSFIMTKLPKSDIDLKLKFKLSSCS